MNPSFYLKQTSRKKYVIDSYAWIEYFRGSSEGLIAQQYIETTTPILPTIVLAEVYNKLLRWIETGNETPEGTEKKINFMMRISEIAELTVDIALKAAEINQQMKKKKEGWGLADSIIYATALLHKALVVTGDEHFRDLPLVIMIK